jgi:hypothetical protein
VRKRTRKVRRGIVLTILFFLICNCAYLLLLHQFRFRYVVIHHTASQVDNYQSIREFHGRKHGWWDAGYHLILSNGSTDIPEGYLEATSRYRNMVYSLSTKSRKHNLFGVHICVVGDYDKQEPSPMVRTSLASAITYLQDRYHIPESNILFHRDCNSTACPGRNITHERVRQWLEDWKNGLPDDIRAQHEVVLGSAGIARSTIRLFVVHLLVLNAVCLAIVGIVVLLRRFF